MTFKMKLSTSTNLREKRKMGTAHQQTKEKMILSWFENICHLAFESMFCFPSNSLTPPPICFEFFNGAN